MDKHVAALRVRLSGVSLAGFNLNSSRQRFSGDTLIVAAYPESALVASMQLPYRYRDLSASRAEPMIESDNRQIVKLAQRIRAGSRDPRVVAQRINDWVHDSIAARVTFGMPSALHVLKSRRGDCDEHAQLYVALARAIGIPARVAGGLAYVDGKFFYHAWPEVLLKDWVAVDPTFGQFPADAAHLRFVNGGVARHTELLRLMDNLKIDIVSVTGGSASRGTRSH
jgi:transglutaminase-like putative cysteine protease